MISFKEAIACTERKLPVGQASMTHRQNFIGITIFVATGLIFCFRRNQLDDVTGRLTLA